MGDSFRGLVSCVPFSVVDAECWFVEGVRDGTQNEGS